MEFEELVNALKKDIPEVEKKYKDMTREKALEIYRKDYSKYVRLVEGEDAKQEYTIYINNDDAFYKITSYGARGVQRKLLYSDTEPEAYYLALGEAAAITSERRREEPDDIDF